MKVKSLSCVRLFSTPWTAAHQAPPSMGFFQARVLQWGAIAFSEAWFNAWQIIIHHCALLLNKEKNCELFTSSHGSPNLQAFCFSHKYVSSPDTRSLLHASTRVKAFYLLGNLTTSRVSSGMTGFTLVFTFWLSH